MNKRNKHIGQISSELEGDSSLRELFQSVGYESAPSQMEDAVIARLQTEKDEALTLAGPLIPTAVWVVIGILVIATVAYALSLPNQLGDHLVSDYLPQWSLPEFQISIPSFTSIFEQVPASLALIIPFILLQFYLIKNFYEGRYSR